MATEKRNTLAFKVFIDYISIVLNIDKNLIAKICTINLLYNTIVHLSSLIFIHHKCEFDHKYFVLIKLLNYRIIYGLPVDRFVNIELVLVQQG